METNIEPMKCRYCGKELPQEAIFCYYCRRELVTRPERPSQEVKPGKFLWWLWVVIVVIGLIAILLIQ